MPTSTVSPDTTKWLNLLRSSPSFVLFEGRRAGDESLQHVDLVPASSGTCWISGSLTTARKDTIDAVHVVNTDDGGQVTQSYAWVDGWHRVEDLPKVMGVEQTEVYPFDYSFSVPLEEDRYSG